MREVGLPRARATDIGKRQTDILPKGKHGLAHVRRPRRVAESHIVVAYAVSLTIPTQHPDQA
jgi:hypothetical protein